MTREGDGTLPDGERAATGRGDRRDRGGRGLLPFAGWLAATALSLVMAAGVVAESLTRDPLLECLDRAGASAPEHVEAPLVRTRWSWFPLGTTCTWQVGSQEHTAGPGLAATLTLGLPVATAAGAVRTVRRSSDTAGQRGLPRSRQRDDGA